MPLELLRDVIACRIERQGHGGARDGNDRREIPGVSQDRIRLFKPRDEHHIAEFRLINWVLRKELCEVVVGVLQDHTVGEVVTFFKQHGRTPLYVESKRESSNHRSVTRKRFGDYSSGTIVTLSPSDASATRC
jgi:hypothetical protein